MVGNVVMSERRRPDSVAAAIIGGLLVAVIGTGTAGAVTRSKVLISDPTSNRLAHVNAEGRLLTATTGNVEAKTTPAGKPFLLTLTQPYRVPTGKTLILTTVSTEAAYVAQGGQVAVDLVLPDGPLFLPLPLHFTFLQQGLDYYNGIDAGLELAVPSGWRVSAQCQTPGSASCSPGAVSLFGYLVSH